MYDYRIPAGDFGCNFSRKLDLLTIGLRLGTGVSIYIASFLCLAIFDNHNKKGDIGMVFESAPTSLIS